MSKCLTALAVAFCLAAPATAQNPPQDTTEVIVQALPRAKPDVDTPPPPLEMFIQSPRVELIALSPDGSRFAYVTTKGGVRILTAYNIVENSPQFIRLGDDPLTSITWVSNDYILLSSTQTGLRGICPAEEGTNYKIAMAKIAADLMRQEKSGIPITPPPRCVSYGVRSQEAATVINLRTEAATPLGNRMGGEYNGMAYGLPQLIMADGKPQMVGAFLELRDKSIAGTVQQRVYLWNFDPDTGKGVIVNDGGGDLDRLGKYVDDWLLDKEGNPVARAVYVYISREFRIETRNNGKWTPVLKRKIDIPTGTLAPSLIGFGRDGESLLIMDVTADASGENRYAYYELSRDGILSEALSPNDATRERPIFHPRTGALAGFSREGETITYTFFDPDLAEYYQDAINTASGKSVRVAAMSHDPARMILHVQGGDDVGSWHYYDFDAAKRIDIGTQYPSVPEEWVASQRTVRYRASDGTEISAVMTLPSQGEAKNRAAVILPHDGPLNYNTRGYDWLAQILASRGYVVLQPNYRGSDGYGTAFTEAGYGQWSVRMLTDIADGVGYLTERGIADPNRICIGGQGYGGYAALKGAQGRYYRCAISINGIADPADYLSKARKTALADDIAAIKVDPQLPRTFRPDPNSPALIQRYFGAQTPSPILPTDISVPVLLIHAQHNKTVDASQSRSVRDSLQRAGKPVTYTELTGCGHSLDTEACRLTTAQAVTDFLAVNNPAK